MIGIKLVGIGIGGGIRKILEFWRVLFVSETADDYTLAYTSGTEATDLQASIGDQSTGFKLNLPAAALASEDADSFTMETDNL